MGTSLQGARGSPSAARRRPSLDVVRGRAMPSDCAASRRSRSRGAAMIRPGRDVRKVGQRRERGAGARPRTRASLVRDDWCKSTRLCHGPPLCAARPDGGAVERGGLWRRRGRRPGRRGRRGADGERDRPRYHLDSDVDGDWLHGRSGGRGPGRHGRHRRPPSCTCCAAARARPPSSSTTDSRDRAPSGSRSSIGPPPRPTRASAPTTGPDAGRATRSMARAPGRISPMTCTP